MTITAFPLCWPVGWARTPAGRRQKGSFTVSLARARDGLLAEIKLLGGRNVVLSSNLQLRNDGLPYAQQRAVDDHGIAVYFEHKKRPMCFACDRYTRMEANLRAIQMTIAALRGIERWGASDMLERAFTGFVALPAPESGWRFALGISDANPTPQDVESAYRTARKAAHPDHGGTSEQFHAVQRAYEDAMKEISK
jgi:hypothetical protein